MSESEAGNRNQLLSNDPSLRGAPSGIEQRAAVRYPLNWKVVLACDRGGKKAFFHGSTRDISMTGACVITPQEISDSELVLLLVVPKQKIVNETMLEIKCGKVFSVFDEKLNLFRIGLRFIEYAGEGQSLLAATFESRFSRSASR